MIWLFYCVVSVWLSGTRSPVPTELYKNRAAKEPRHATGSWSSRFGWESTRRPPLVLAPRTREAAKHSRADLDMRTTAAMASSSRPSGLALPTPATGQACIATGIGAQSGTYITHLEAFQCYPTIDKPLAVTHGPEAALVSYHALLELPELKHSSFARIGDGRPHLLPSPHTPNCRTHYRRFDHRDTAHLIRDRPPTAHSVHRPNSRQDGVRQRRRPERRYGAAHAARTHVPAEPTAALTVHARRWNPRRHGQIEEGRGQVSRREAAHPA